MLQIALPFAFAFCCMAAETGVVRVEAKLETGSQAGRTIPVTLVYDAGAVGAAGESVIPAVPVGEQVTALQRCEAVFHDGLLQSIRIFLRLEGADSPVHNLVIGVAGPGTLSYVDQTGGTGGGSYRLETVPNSGNLSVIRPLPEPFELHRQQGAIVPDGAHPGLLIFAPEPLGANPLHLVHPSAAPGLLVVDPAPLRLTPLPPPR